MKIAFITYGNSDDKTSFNVVHNRVKHLLVTKNFEINVYIIQTYDNLPIRILQKSKKRIKEDYFIYDNVRYKNLWFNRSVIDHLIRIMKVNCRGLFFSLSCYKWTKLFKEYNFISANSYYAGLLAYNINFKYKIPFSISWTGSDIHTYPFLNPSMFKWTKRLLVSAQNNFFCSEKLAETSTKIALETNRVVLYHGVDKNLFKKYDVSQLNSIKKEFLINSNNKNVAFFGRLESIKNIHYLPKIFNRIKTNIPYTSFFIIGDGKLRQVIQKECDKLDFKVSILGYIDLLYMPALINCMDLILLPSKNEGLPVIALESIACGVPIIGSRVGGIPEVIGLENTVEINEMFIEKFSTLAIDVLSQKRDIMLNPVFDWDKTAELEGRIYDKYK